MRVTVSLNEQASERARPEAIPDLAKLVVDNSRAKVLRVFGRGQFVEHRSDQRGPPSA